MVTDQDPLSAISEQSLLQRNLELLCRPRDRNPSAKKRVSIDPSQTDCAFHQCPAFASPHWRIYRLENDSGDFMVPELIPDWDCDF